MKEFTEKDLVPHAGSVGLFLDDNHNDLVLSELPWQKRGLQQTSTGYGAKLTSSFKISFEGKLYRLYHTCYGNASSAWFTVKGRKIYVN
jgi:hypothetical protein